MVCVAGSERTEGGTSIDCIINISNCWYTAYLRAFPARILPLALYRYATSNGEQQYSYDPHGFQLGDGVDVRGSMICLPNSYVLWEPKHSADITVESLRLLELVTPKIGAIPYSSDRHHAVVCTLSYFVPGMAVDAELSLLIVYFYERSEQG